MRKLIWQNSLGSIDLTKAPYGIINWEGFSNAPLNIQSQQVPMQDGSVFLDALIENRDLSVTLSIQDNNDLEKRYELERQLIHILNPKLGEGYLIYTNDFISKRIKCIPQIPLFPNKNSNDPGTQKSSLSWTACEPYWEDLEETSVLLKGNRNIIQNNGDVNINIKLEMDVGVGSFILKNITNEEIIEAENLDVNKNHIMNTNIGEKSIVGVNKSLKFCCGGNTVDLITINDYLYMLQDEIIIKYNIVNDDFEKIQLPFHNCIKILYIPDRNLYCILSSNEVNVSNDLENWTSYHLENNPFKAYDLNYINGVIYVISHSFNESSSIIYTSSDGVIWQSQIFSNLKLNSICYAENKFCIVGNGKILMGVDLNNLTIIDVEYNLVKVRYLNNKFIAIYESDSFHGSGIMYLTQGQETWISSNSFSGQNLTDLIYFKSRYLFVGGGNVYITNDLSTFKRLEMTSWTVSLYITYNVNFSILFLAGSEGYFSLSLNADDWVNMSEGFVKFTNVWPFNEIFYLNDKFVSGSYLYYFSKDGQKWNETNISLNCLDICYKNGIYVGINVSGNRLYKSNDFINWIIINPQLNNLRHICFGDKFLINTDKQIYTNSNSDFSSLELLYTLPDNYTFVSSIVFLEDKYYLVALEQNRYSTLIIVGNNNDWRTIQYNTNHQYYFRDITYGYDCIYVLGYESSEGVYILKYDINGNITKFNLETEGAVRIINCKSYYAILTENGLYIWNENYIQKISSSSYKNGRYNNGVLVLVTNDEVIERIININEVNEISKLSNNSNMNFKLNVGENILLYNDDHNKYSILTYRQKYIGV